MTEHKPAESSLEDRVTGLENKMDALELATEYGNKRLLATFKLLRRISEKLELEIQDEGGFKDDTPTEEDQKDVSDQQDWLDELETDVDDDG